MSEYFHKSHNITVLMYHLVFSAKYRGQSSMLMWMMCSKKLLGGEFWSGEYFATTVGKHGDEHMIEKYVKNQGNEYIKIQKDRQSSLF